MLPVTGALKSHSVVQSGSVNQPSNVLPFVMVGSGAGFTTLSPCFTVCGLGEASVPPRESNLTSYVCWSALGVHFAYKSKSVVTGVVKSYAEVQLSSVYQPPNV